MSDIEAIVVIVIVAWIGKHVLKGVFGFHSRNTGETGEIHADEKVLLVIR